MKPMVPALTPLLRSNAQGDLLALLLLHPDREYSLADATRYTGAQGATVHREAERLVAADIVLDRRVGRSRMLRANPHHEWFGPLEALLRLSYGPRAVLEPLIASLPGVQSAYIYGSWAARYAGEVGPPPADIDVLVVGTTPRAELAKIARAAEQELRREVNITRVSIADWQAEATPFIHTLKDRPMLPLRTDKMDT